MIAGPVKRLLVLIALVTACAGSAALAQSDSESTSTETSTSTSDSESTSTETSTSTSDSESARSTSTEDVEKALGDGLGVQNDVYQGLHTNYERSPDLSPIAVGMFILCALVGIPLGIIHNLQEKKIAQAAEREAFCHKREYKASLEQAWEAVTDIVDKAKFDSGKTKWNFDSRKPEKQEMTLSMTATQTMKPPAFSKLTPEQYGRYAQGSIHFVEQTDTVVLNFDWVYDCQEPYWERKKPGERLMQTRILDLYRQLDKHLGPPKIANQGKSSKTSSKPAA